MQLPSIGSRAGTHVQPEALLRASQEELEFKMLCRTPREAEDSWSQHYNSVGAAIHMHACVAFADVHDGCSYCDDGILPGASTPSQTMALRATP